MEVREIEARTLLQPVRQPDGWFGLDYGMNLYRGCQHQCVYCDTRSECYGLDGFSHEVLVKANALELLERELPRKRRKGVVGLGSMNDAYMPLERERRLTRRALEVLLRHGFPLHVLTKSDLVSRDLDLLREIGKVFAAVSFSLTTADDLLARRLEPGAPPPSARLAAMRALAEAGVPTGVVLMPVLPFLTDEEESVVEVLRRASAHGASYAIAAFGMTLRDRQRSFYYAALDRDFPGLRPRYEKAFGDRYSAPARRPKALAEAFARACAEAGVAPRFPGWRREESPGTQRRLF